MREYSASVPKPGLQSVNPARLSGEQDAIEAAIARGDAAARSLISARDKLFEPMRDILKVAGRDGLMACILGVYLAVNGERDGGR